jgi:predicted acetyltransferase
VKKWRVRPARDEDIPAYAAICKRCFTWGTDTVEELAEDFRENPRGGVECIYVAEGENGLVGGLVNFPLRMYFRGRAVDCGGVAEVAVDPTVRRQGVAAAMMNWLLRREHRQGAPVSMLFPFRHDFYEAYGYGLISCSNDLRLRPTALPTFPERKLVRPLRDEDLHGVMRLHEASRRKVDFRFARNAAYWRKNLLTKERHLVVVEDRGRISGYILFRYGIRDDRSCIWVSEMIASDERAYRAIVGFLSTQREQVEGVRCSLNHDDPLRWLVSDPTDVKTEERSFISPWFGGRVSLGLMLRFVRLGEALEGLHVNDIPAAFDLKLDDAQLPANKKAIRVVARKGALSVRKPFGSGSMLKTDSATFSKIITGKVRVSDAVTWRKAQAPEPLARRLDELFADPPPDGFLSLDIF